MAAILRHPDRPLCPALLLFRSAMGQVARQSAQHRIRDLAGSLGERRSHRHRPVHGGRAVEGDTKPQRIYDMESWHALATDPCSQRTFCRTSFHR
ncbi:MAG: hypothetical protein WCO98_01625 [bacterium]